MQSLRRVIRASDLFGEVQLENKDDFVRKKYSKDFDRFSKEVLPTEQIIYHYDNGSVMYSYEFTEL